MNFNKLTYYNATQINDHFVECIQNNNLESFNFPDACIGLKFIIDSTLIDYGQCSEEMFIAFNLKDKFPDLTEEEFKHYYGNEDEIFAVCKKENRDYSLKDLLPAYKKLEALRYNKLKIEYEDDPDILSLKSISTCLQVCFEEEDIFPQDGKIRLISDALEAKHPRGLVFSYLFTDK